MRSDYENSIKKNPRKIITNFTNNTFSENEISVLELGLKSLVLLRPKEDKISATVRMCGNKKRAETKYTDPFLVNGLIPYPLKTPENRRFSAAFKGCQMGTSTRNGLKDYHMSKVRGQPALKLFSYSCIDQYPSRYVPVQSQ